MSPPFAVARKAPQPAFGATVPALPSVAIVATGGTIAARWDPATGGAAHALGATDLVLARRDLSKLTNIDMLSLSEIESSQMTPALSVRRFGPG